MGNNIRNTDDREFIKDYLSKRVDRLLNTEDGVYRFQYKPSQVTNKWYGYTGRTKDRVIGDLVIIIVNDSNYQLHPNAFDALAGDSEDITHSNTLEE